ncbi:MAG TPA: rod shape-determining protein RodA [Candidatus Portnoybacteria bacterium]|nr:rod shape-determining protein RodA [Candidatus Portnoybacteria bacterium]
MPKITNYLKNIHWPIIIPIIIIIVFSLLNLYSISHSINSSHLVFKKQIIFCLLGIAIFFWLSKFNWSILKNFSTPILFFYFTSIILLFLPIILQQQIRDTHSWIKFGPLDFQPVETVKISLILVLAKYFSSRHIELYKIRHLIISGGYLVIPLIIVLLQPDLGSAIVLLAIWTGMILLSGVRTKHFIFIIIIGLILSFLGWNNFLKPYQKERIIGFLHPQEKINSQNYNLHQSLIAIGSGGITGQGILRGHQSQLGFLPEKQSDFAFAAFAEEWGLIGCLALILTYFYLFYQLIKNSSRMNNNFSRLYLSGFCIYLLTQSSINFGVNLGLLPVTGISLPFFSAGGSNLLINFVMLAIAESVIQHNNKY